MWTLSQILSFPFFLGKYLVIFFKVTNQPWVTLEKHYIVIVVSIGVVSVLFHAFSYNGVWFRRLIFNGMLNHFQCGRSFSAIFQSPENPFSSHIQHNDLKPTETYSIVSKRTKWEKNIAMETTVIGPKNGPIVWNLIWCLLSKWLTVVPVLCHSYQLFPSNQASLAIFGKGETLPLGVLGSHLPLSHAFPIPSIKHLLKPNLKPKLRQFNYLVVNTFN